MLDKATQDKIAAATQAPWEARAEAGELVDRVALVRELEELLLAPPAIAANKAA